MLIIIDVLVDHHFNHCRSSYTSMEKAWMKLCSMNVCFVEEVPLGRPQFRSFTWDPVNMVSRTG